MIPGLHAYSLQLAAGLRHLRPPDKSLFTVHKMLAWAQSLKLSAVQLAKSQLPMMENSSDRMVELLKIRENAGDLTLHLSTNKLEGPHLEEMIRTAHTLGAKQVTVPLSRLSGTVQERKKRLETLLKYLDIAIHRADRYQVMLTIENGRHTSAADLAALIDAAQSDWFKACFDIGNALSVPESPAEAATILLPHCKSVHVKDLQVFRYKEGVLLKNCPLGQGIVGLDEVLDVFAAQPELIFFIQTAAEIVQVPLLDDKFLVEYPRITARALAALLSKGKNDYTPAELKYPHENNFSWGDLIKWEKKQVTISHDYLLSKIEKEKEKVHAIQKDKEKEKSMVLDFNKPLS